MEVHKYARDDFQPYLMAIDVPDRILRGKNSASVTETISTDYEPCPMPSGAFKWSLIHGY
jgi:hypothetical protein